MLAAITIGCSSPGPQACGPDLGIDAVWTEDGGVILVGSVQRVYYSGEPEAFRQSIDGGWNWTAPPVIRGPHDFAVLQSIEAPRGTYEIRDSDIVLMTPDAPARITYSAAHLSSGANQWIQWQATESWGDREITTYPYALAYDGHHDSVVAAMGLQGVVVGTPDRVWRPVAVGPYVPTDFSTGTKIRTLLTHSNLRSTVVAVAASVVAAIVALRRFTPDRGRGSTSAVVFSTAALLFLLLGLGWLLLLAGVGAVLITSLRRYGGGRRVIRISAMVLVAVILAMAGAVFAVVIALGLGFLIVYSLLDSYHTIFWLVYATSIGAGVAVTGFVLWRWVGDRFSAVLAVGLALAGAILAGLLGPLFVLLGVGMPNPVGASYAGFVMGPALAYAVLALALSWHVFRWWPAIVVASIGIGAVMVGAATLWMWSNMSLFLFKLMATAPTALIAWALWRYLRAKQQPQLDDEAAFPMVEE